MAKTLANEGRGPTVRNWRAAEKVVPEPKTQAELARIGSPPLQKPVTGADLLRRDGFSVETLKGFGLEVRQRRCDFGASRNRH